MLPTRTLERILFFLLFISFLPPESLFSQDLDSLLNNKRIYRAIPIGDLPLPKIDGELNDTIWQLGDWQGNFTQQQPYGGARGTERTYVKVLYDHSNLFVSIICQDSEPGKIRDIFDRRDALSGDMTGIAFDSYYDRKTAFEFNVSAAGQKTDIKHRGDYIWDLNWDAVWDGASARIDSGWVAEMRIPFSQLRYANREEHLWGMHVWRWIDRKKEEDQWQYIPLEAPAMVYLFGKLEGVKNIRSSRQVEFLPYALGSYNGESGIKSPAGISGGIDAKIGISSDYTLDLSINPDFGQVEADPSVLNLTSFETFFEEKRPFFLEGTEIFDFELGGDIPYYSRRIGSAPQFPGSNPDLQLSDIPERTTILSAGKFTGKTRNGLSIGLVNGITSKEYATATYPDGSTMDIEMAPVSNYLASRVKKEFGEGNSSIGGFFSMVDRMYTENSDPDLLPSEAYSGGLDLLHHWRNRNYFIEAKTIASRLNGSPEAILLKQLSHNHRYQRPDAGYLEVDSLADHLSGHGGLIRAGKKGGSWNFSGTGQYRSPGLNLNDMGYIRQSDYISERVEASYDMNEPTRWLRDYTLEVFQQSGWSFGGENTENIAGAEFQFTNLKLWSFQAEIEYQFSHLDPRALWGGPALRIDPNYELELSGKSNTSKNLYAWIELRYNGSAMDHFFSRNIETGITWLPARRIRFFLEADFTAQEHYQHYVTNLENNGSLVSVVGNIERRTASFILRGELFMTPEISLQYYGNPYFSSGDYDSFKRIRDAGNMSLEERFDPLDAVYLSGSNTYSFDYEGGSFSFRNPDFSFMQYRSNLVFRWEYHPGSTIYMVWSHSRFDSRNLYSPLSGIRGDLFGLEGNNIFMLKLNYWFSL